MLLPSSKVIGEHMAQYVNDLFNAKDRSNVRSHVEQVASEGVTVDIENATTKKKRKLLEWAEHAADVDPASDPAIAAAWRAALEDIMTTSDYHMLDIVKQLTSHEIKALVDFSVKYNYFSVKYKYETPRLVALGLIKRDFSWSDYLETRLALYITLPLTLIMLYFIPDIIQEVFPGRSNVLSNSLLKYRNIMTLSFSLSIVILILVERTSIIKRIKSYSLTPFGKELATRIAKYLPGQIS
jgi:hypothetical protein